MKYSSNSSNILINLCLSDYNDFRIFLEGDLLGRVLLLGAIGYNILLWKKVKQHKHIHVPVFKTSAAIKCGSQEENCFRHNSNIVGTEVPERLYRSIGLIFV